MYAVAIGLLGQALFDSNTLQSLDKISASNHQIIITGDFNLPQLFCNDSVPVNNHRFIDALNDNFLHQINIYPTRNNNILDLLITNIPELLCITDIITPDQMGICTDHTGRLTI